MTESTQDSGREVRTAVADLAGRLGVDEGAITVESVHQVTWRDGSLGCAEDGMLYTQALVEGRRIILGAREERYEYHAGGGRSVFLCEAPSE